MRLKFWEKKRLEWKARIPVLYEMSGGWGDRIEWSTIGSRVTGWKQRIPEVGDLISSPMQSGKTGLYRVTDVEQMLDPRDMFFADVEEAFYLDEYEGEYTLDKERKATFLK